MSHRLSCTASSRVVAWVAMAAVVATLVLSAGPPVHAQATDGDPAEAPPDLLDPRLSPTLAKVAVDSPAYRSALASFRQTEARLTDARARVERDETSLRELRLAEARLIGEVNEANRRREKSQRRVDELRVAVQGLAVASYLAGGATDSLGALDLDAFTEQRRRQVLVDTVSTEQLVEYRAHREAVEQADAVVAADLPALDEVRRRVGETEVSRDVAQRDAATAESELWRRSRVLADARLEARVVGLDLSLVALDAYVRAATTMAFERPACGVRWQALAGIGRTESGHGTYGGAMVRADGVLSKPIIGVPLDGTNGNQTITDTDGGELDGDPLLDRAVGPMQFIPTSWGAFGRDGNGDGRRDPQNLYDSALAAAVLLCRVSPLTDDGALRRSFLRYNASGAYADLVLERTRGYDRFVIPDA